MAPGIPTPQQDLSNSTLFYRRPLGVLYPLSGDLSEYSTLFSVDPLASETKRDSRPSGENSLAKICPQKCFGGRVRGEGRHRRPSASLKLAAVSDSGALAGWEWPPTARRPHRRYFRGGGFWPFETLSTTSARHHHVVLRQDTTKNSQKRVSLKTQVKRLSPQRGG